MSSKVEAFESHRKRMNEKILDTDNLETKRFFNLDSAIYRDGALSGKTKELLGLVASMVLRCNDCISYHIIQCAKQGVTDEEFEEAFSVALVVGGSITIPHLRHAHEVLEDVRQGDKDRF